MARVTRSELFVPDEIAIVHVVNRVVRRCFLLGDVLCQRIAIRANREDGEPGKFWQSRFRAVRLVDEQALLACAAYVDLNPIRAAMAQTLEDSGHTSVQRRIQAEQAKGTDEHREERLSGTHQHQSGQRPTGAAPTAPDRFLSPLELDEQHGPAGACGSSSLGVRCSDKGFLPMSVPDYLELLDWTARRTAPGKCGSTPADTPPVLERLRLSPTTWCELASNFGRLFSAMAGHPQNVEAARNRRSGRRSHLTPRIRELLA